jgi:hypothetical protein
MKRILGFMLDVEVTETDDGAELPQTWEQDEGLFELGRLLKDTNRKAKAKAIAHVQARQKAVSEARKEQDATIQ